MISTSKLFTLISLSVMILFSSVILVQQIYEYRTSLSLSDQLQIKSEELSFQTNILLEEISFFRNQTNLRKVAIETLNMHSPSSSEKIIIFKEREK